MSLPKKDVRTAIPADLHDALRVLVGMSKFPTIERYVESLLCRHVVREANAAIMLADEFRRAGIDGTIRESQFSNGDEL
jgi:hypothetical protein